MSKRRNRSIRTLPTYNFSFEHPLPEPKNEFVKERQYFGEEIANESPPVAINNFNVELSSDDSLGSIIRGIKDLGTGKSSSSSLSWGGEYKNEASKRIKDELDRMDRILTGQEPIPDEYDAEEYQEWMTFFPNLCVTGMPLNNLPEGPVAPGDFEEILAIHPEIDADPLLEDCDDVINNSNVQILVDQICKTINDRLTKPMKPVKSATKPTMEPSNPTSFNIDIDDFLKVSPLTPKKPLSKRESSSRSLVSSHLSSSKWLKDDSQDTQEYTSLPFVVENVTIKNRLFYSKDLAPKGILKNSLILPPIDQYRSVSATPRRSSKSLSALSVNGDRSRIEPIKYFVKNGIRRNVRTVEKRRSVNDISN